MHKIIEKIKLLSKNYISFEKWIVIERNLSEEMKIIPAKVSVEACAGHFDETVEYIRKSFYKGELDSEEKKEIEAARIHSHFYPHVKYDGKIVGFQKIGSGSIYIRSIRKYVKFREDVALSYAFFVDKAYRRKGIAAHLMSFSLMRAKEMGYSYVRGQVSPGNRASIALCSRCGFYEIARFWHFRFFHWDYTTLDIGKADRNNRVSLDPSSDIETFRKEVI